MCLCVIGICRYCWPSFLVHNCHRAEKEKLCQMQEHYEMLLNKARVELESLRKQVDEFHQKILFPEKWYVSCLPWSWTSCQTSGWLKDHFTQHFLFLCSCEERENEAEELRQQLQSQTSELKRAKEACSCYEEEEQQLRVEIKYLQHKLEEEKRRTASCDLQVFRGGLHIEWAAPSFFRVGTSCLLLLSSGESLSEVSVGLSPRRPQEDWRSGATGMGTDTGTSSSVLLPITL